MIQRAAVGRMHTGVKAGMAGVLSLGRLNRGVGVTASMPDTTSCASLATYGVLGSRPVLPKRVGGHPAGEFPVEDL